MVFRLLRTIQELSTKQFHGLSRITGHGMMNRLVIDIVGIRIPDIKQCFLQGFT
ncbi:hypothetical protein ECTPHS_10239 [Ectothiorhodospira sp. PHS-1]|nr:hypothetical protein ECTPHS_10239 [Ectothiorhodospira sp. PHS-1]